MKAIVILNAAAGLRTSQIDEEAARVHEGLSARGLAVEVRQVRGAETGPAAVTAVRERADVIVMGGGDGTVSAGAGALAGGGTPMAVLPLGTRNHFARDAGIPQDLDAALDVVARGRVRRVDVGEANGRVFVNNTSMGLYPEAVRGREERRGARGSGKWLAMGRSALGTLHRFPVLRVTVHLADGAVRLATPLVFVGNNRYEMSLFALGRRPSLEEGELWLYLARENGRFGIAGLAARAALGRLNQARDFLGLGVADLVVEDRRRAMRVAFDGEVCEMSSPLRYRIRPRALPILVPATTE